MADAGAKLVFADNLYVYGPPEGPMTEETPQRAQGKKGRIRIEMAADVLQAHRDGKLRCTIGRSSDYYGPRGTRTTAGDNLMKPALRGKRARWLGSLDQPHTLNYLEDMGRALVTLGERQEADGQVWHLPAAEPLTGRQFLTLVYEAAGLAPKVGVARRPMVRLVGVFNPLVRELNETLYQFERPFVSDASKFQGAFGPFEPTSHRGAVRRTVEWIRAPARRLSSCPAGRPGGACPLPRRCRCESRTRTANTFRSRPPRLAPSMPAGPRTPMPTRRVSQPLLTMSNASRRRDGRARSHQGLRPAVPGNLPG